MMKKFAVLPFAALAFAACSDTDGPLAVAPDGPAFNLVDGKLVAPTVNSATVSADGETLNVVWSAVAGVNHYQVVVQGPALGIPPAAVYNLTTAGLDIKAKTLTPKHCVKVRAIANDPGNSSRFGNCVAPGSGSGGGETGGETGGTELPSIDMGGPYSADEGGAITFDWQVTAGSTAIASYEWNYGDGRGPAISAGSGSSLPSPNRHTYGDNPAAPATAWTATLKVKDGAGNVLAEEQVAVTISNRAPVMINALATITTPAYPTSFVYNPYTGVAEAKVSFSDVGFLDVVTASFSGITNLTSPNNTRGPATSGPLTGTFTANQTFSAGTCVTGAISVRVSDDDATATQGFFDHEFATAGALERNTATWMAPIKGGTRNVVKHGNVIPVKLSVLDCNGAVLTGKTLTIKLTSASNSQGEDVPTEDVATSVSSADTGNQMRMAGDHYMYNLATKGLTVGHPYTITIFDGTHVVATAFISTK